MLKTVEYRDEELIVLDQTLLPASVVYEKLGTAQSVFDAIAGLKVRGAPLIGVVAAYGILVGLKNIRNIRETSDCVGGPAFFSNPFGEVEDPTSSTSSISEVECSALSSSPLRKAKDPASSNGPGQVHDISREPDNLISEVEQLCSYLQGARPTAVNLSWAFNRMLEAARNADEGDSRDSLYEALTREARAIHEEDSGINRRIGIETCPLVRERIKDNTITILTHCNAGALATTGYGTATSVMYLLKEQGVDVKVYVCETRPLLQGARLTTLELAEAGMDVTLITDSMAAKVMADGIVDIVIVGADRVSANLDVANKIGTLGLSLIARHYQVPFYVACPSPSFDRNIACGEDIIIEERDGSEITSIGGTAIAPQGTRTYNPAFDITPYENVTAIITENGVLGRP